MLYRACHLSGKPSCSPRASDPTQKLHSLPLPFPCKTPPLLHNTADLAGRSPAGFLLEFFRTFMRKLLVANRSEIAIRIFRAATELGLGTIAVYTYEDRFSLHRFKADESYQI